MSTYEGSEDDAFEPYPAHHDAGFEGDEEPTRLVVPPAAELKDLIRHWRKGRATRNLWEAFSDAYIAVIAALMIGGALVNVVVRAQRVVSECTSESCLSARTVLPWAALVAVGRPGAGGLPPLRSGAGVGGRGVLAPRHARQPVPAARPAADGRPGDRVGGRRAGRCGDRRAHRRLGPGDRGVVRRDRVGRHLRRLLRRRAARSGTAPTDPGGDLPVRRPRGGRAGGRDRDRRRTGSACPSRPGPTPRSGSG